VQGLSTFLLCASLEHAGAYSKIYVLYFFMHFMLINFTTHYDAHNTYRLSRRGRNEYWMQTTPEQCKIKVPFWRIVVYVTIASIK